MSALNKDTFAKAFKKTQAAALALKRMQAGEKLTKEQEELIAEIGGEVSEDAPLNEPKFVKSQVDLARVLELSRKTIQRYAKLKDAPEARSDGRLSVPAWRKFLAKHDVNCDPDDAEAISLKEQQILLQNKLLQQKFDANARLLISAEQVEQETAALIAAAKTVLLQGPSSLAPQVVGVSVQEAETLMKEWLHNALTKLQKNPLGK